VDCFISGGGGEAKALYTKQDIFVIIPLRRCIFANPIKYLWTGRWLARSSAEKTCVICKFAVSKSIFLPSFALHGERLINTDYIPVTMVCLTLSDTPHFSLPAEYAIRTYRPGDETAWAAIQNEADDYNAITPALFEQAFGSDQALLEARQLYLLDKSGREIGTSTAWFGDDEWGNAYGRVHWVAIVPEFQGRGLAKPLMSATCAALKEAGHERAYLTTDLKRVVALNLYRKFGFAIEK